MGHEKPKPSPEMVAHVKRLRLARELALAVERRNQVHSDASTSKPSAVAKRLAANHAVHVAAHRMLAGGSDE